MPPLTFFPHRLALSVAPFDPKDITEVRTPTDFMYLIPPLKRERQRKTWWGEARERRRDHKVLWTETVGEQAIFPPSPVWYQREGDCINSALPLLCQNCCNLDYTNSSNASRGKLCVLCLFLFLSLINSGSHVLVYKEPHPITNLGVVSLNTTGRQQMMTDDTGKINEVKS